jgi:predicted SAM-dependent methyltransferase/glycosyltransferase involved in cell wall biosynthesis
MQQKLLNIGSGQKKIDGFINIDIDKNADIQIDVTKGLPFQDNSISGIFCEHFIEHLRQREAIKFLRECRRILVPDGLLRIATPDLDFLLIKYCNDWKNQAWIEEFGYQWIDNKCECLNLAMREWDHKWVFNEEELTRIGVLAGLHYFKRCDYGKSDWSYFRGLEWRSDSKLIIEFKKKLCILKEPLVSILIPAYTPDFIELCLNSAIAQTYGNIEIIVCDDNPESEIKNKIEKFLKKDHRIRYFKNKQNIGAVENYIRCFSLANGDYIKFLNDDDMLHPTCVERMIKCFHENPEVTLVTSHRQCIDASGNLLNDFEATARPVMEDSLIKGTSAAASMVKRCLNFIGEPTTAMFRREDLETNKPNILSFAGRKYVFNVDVAMWMNLLSKGDLIYIYDSLSFFRIHEKQEQRKPGANERGRLAWHFLREDCKRMALWDCNIEDGGLAVKSLEKYSGNLSMECLKYNGKIKADMIDDKKIISTKRHACLIKELLTKGKVALNAEKLKEACNIYINVIELDSCNKEAITSLGIVAYRASMMESAYFFFKKAEMIDPNDPSIKDYLIKCHEIML